MSPSPSPEVRAAYRRAYGSTPEGKRKAVEGQLRLQKKKMALVREYRAARGCMDCGERDSVVLELDHRDPATKHPKLRSLSRRGTGGKHWRRLSYAAIAEELAKCDVVCANCHRRRTVARGHNVLGRAGVTG